VKRIHRVLGTTIALASLSGAGFGCTPDLPIDDPNENPGVLPPLGAIRGTAAYLGPSPCFRNGQVEGALVVLLFDATNPPPPNGLATTALNFAAVPGEKLFANLPRPTTGPGSPQKPNESLCGSVDGPTVSAATEFSMQQIAAGRYIVQAFYSRQNRFNALFDYANLPLAGDVPGAALVNPLATFPVFATIDVGVPATIPDQCKGAPTTWAADVQKFCTQKVADVAAGRLEIPPSGFLREGVAVNLGGVFKTNRPFFHIDYAGSRSFEDTFGTDPAKLPKDFSDNYLTQRKAITGADGKALGLVKFGQDHASTSQQKQLDEMTGEACLINKDPACDIFQFAQASFPQIRVNYGFPGNANDPKAAGPSDAWIAKNAKPANPFIPENVRAYYGIDPVDPLVVKDIPTAGSFQLSRNFDPKTGKPVIVADNKALQDLAQIADLFPQVVLAKLVEDENGNVLFPARPQTDPVVVIQGITLRDTHDLAGKPTGVGSMKATSQGSATGGGLTKTIPTDPSHPFGEAGDPDPNQPLNQLGGMESANSFTALLRPSTLCVHPEEGFKGILVTPLLTDPNPENVGAELVSKDLVLATKGNLVKDVQFGCMPPGHYAVNVVYSTGQAWSLPNLMGQCSADARFQPNEDCSVPGQPALATFPDALADAWIGDPAKDPSKGFPNRPLVKSQMLWQTNPDGSFKFAPDGKTKLPQIVVVEPSARCGSFHKETEFSCASTDPDSGAYKKCPVPYRGACIAGADGKPYCDVNGDGKISTNAIWMNNTVNEDIALDMGATMSPKSANGILDPGEDTSDGMKPGADGKLQSMVPNVCALPYAAYSALGK
jgi:hypothetical protein